MPIVDLAALWRMTLGGLALGLGVAAIYDAMRFVRACCAPRLSGLLLQVGDFLWGIFCGCAVAVCLSAASDGRFRWPFAAALIFGFFAWRMTLGRLVRAVTPACARWIRHSLARVLWLISRPLVWGGRAVAAGVSMLVHRVTAPIYTRGAMRRTLRHLSRAFSKFEMEG